MNEETFNPNNYERTVRSNEDLRNSMEGVINEPNKDMSMENQKSVENQKNIQSVD